MVRKAKKREEELGRWTSGETTGELGPSHEGSNMRPQGPGGATAFEKAKPGEGGPPEGYRRRREP